MNFASNIVEPIFEREVLDRHTMSNESLQRELFILFFDQVPVYLDQMDEALASGDVDNWRMAAHGIKGSSRALGFTRLATLSKECESSSPDAERMALLRAAIKETEACIALAETG